MTEEASPGDEPLTSLGERRIIAEMIKPLFSATDAVIRGPGDDAAVLTVKPGHELLVTADPCPVPVVALLGDNDLWHWGRLTHVISLSDLAASGAEPLGMVISTVMPEKMRVAEYRRYLESLEYHARLWGCPVVGGNIKDGNDFTSCSTAFGQAPVGSSLPRSGARPGDAVCVIGEVGHFWSAVLSRMHSWDDIEGMYSEIFQKALLEPVPRLREGRLLATSGHTTSCIDASDGFGAALELLAASNSLDILLDESLVPIPSCVAQVAAREKLDPLSLALSWGDWQLVFTASPENADELVRSINELGSPCHRVGKVSVSREGRLLLTSGDLGTARPIRSFGSERFTASSYFTHGLESYVELLRLGPFLDSSLNMNRAGEET